MINSRSGGLNNVNPNQIHQNRANLQGQQQQRHHQQHAGHNHQNNAQSVNRNSSSTIPGQNRPQRPPMNQQQQQQQNHHSGQQVRSSSAHPSNQMSHSRPHSAANQNTAKPNPNPSQPAVNNGPPLPQVLPKGWKREEVIRTKGITAGLVDVVYVPQPNSEFSNSEIVGKKFKNKIELRKYFGSKYDTSLLDYKSGKVAQIAWRRQRRMKSIAANSSNYASAAKYDTYLNVPVRQNTSVLKQGVFCVTNNHRNDPTPANVLNTIQTTGPNGQIQTRTNEKPKPIQLFWELRFNNIKAVDSRLVGLEHIDDEFQLENIPKFKNFSTTNETVLRSVAASWYLNQNKILIGQEKDFVKNARIFIDREQPLIPQTSVKEDEIKSQETKVKEMRKLLQSALDDLEYVDRIDTKLELDLDDDLVSDECNEQVVEEQKIDVINESESIDV